MAKNEKLKTKKMACPLSKKQIAATAGTSLRTMQRHRQDWSFINRFACRRSGRPVFRPDVLDEARRRRLI